MIVGSVGKVFIQKFNTNIKYAIGFKANPRMTVSHWLIFKFYVIDFEKVVNF